MYIIKITLTRYENMWKKHKMSGDNRTDTSWDLDGVLIVTCCEDSINNI